MSGNGIVIEGLQKRWRIYHIRDGRTHEEAGEGKEVRQAQSGTICR